MTKYYTKKEIDDMEDEFYNEIDYNTDLKDDNWRGNFNRTYYEKRMKPFWKVW